MRIACAFTAMMLGVVAGADAYNHPQRNQVQRRQMQATPSTWEAAQRQADDEIEDEEAEIVHQQMVEDSQRRDKAVRLHNHDSDEEEEALTFGTRRNIRSFNRSGTSTPDGRMLYRGVRRGCSDGSDRGRGKRLRR